MPRFFLLRLSTALCFCLLVCGEVWAFVPSSGTGSADASRWTVTSQGPTGLAGRPASLTWSIVPDGTLAFDIENSQFEGSDLIAMLDAEFGAGPGGSNLMLRPWFTHINAAFERWDALSGLSFEYEDDDDGSTHGGTLAPGQNNVRGDIRLAGVGLDGSSGTLAYSAFPVDGGDQALDTDDASFFGNPSSTFRQLRNTIMHELGHGLGLDHVVTDADFLMEASINTLFDGPQHDDLRGIHWFYGDALEKTNNGQGNENHTLATNLGTLFTGSSLAIGTSGNGTEIGPDEIDFVSIANPQDDDYFSFTVSEAVRLDVTLTPRGGQYTQSGTPFDTTTTSDLALTLFDTNGTSVLSTASSQPAGVVESIDSFVLPAGGQYFVRVDGADPVVQFYELLVAAESLVPSLLGDYNENGVVDAADFTVWRDSFGQSVGAYSGADGDGDGLIGPGDYSVWSSNFGSSASSGLSVPEPGAITLLFSGILLFVRRCRVRYS